MRYPCNYRIHDRTFPRFLVAIQPSALASLLLLTPPIIQRLQRESILIVDRRQRGFCRTNPALLAIAMASPESVICRRHMSLTKLKQRASRDRRGYFQRSRNEERCPSRAANVEWLVGNQGQMSSASARPREQRMIFGQM